MRVLHRDGDPGEQLSTVRSAHFDELGARTLHGMLKLRQDVFIVEQQCAYSDIDARDTEPATLHLWIEEDGDVVCAARVLDHGDGVHKIGRVVTSRNHRGRGLGAAIMQRAIALVGPPIILDAQAHLAGWYATMGFEACGEDFMEVGILHRPMRLG